MPSQPPSMMPGEVEDIPKLEKDHPSVQKLLEFDANYMKLEKEFMKESYKLTQKYQKMQDEFLQKRSEVVAEKEEVPNFWIHVLKSHPVLADEIMPHDLPVLKHLKNVRSENLPDPEEMGQNGFQITFEFEENDFMEQTELTKIVETEFVSEHLTEITCKEVKMVEDIKWKVGKDVTIEMKKQRANKKNASKKPVLKKEPRKSFFRTFFRTIDVENPEEIQDLLNNAMQEMGMDHEEELDEEDQQEMFEEALEKVQDDAYEIACTLHNNIIPHAVKFYTGDAMPQDDDEGEEDDEDEDDEDEDDDEESIEGSSDGEDGEKKEKMPPKELFKPSEGNTLGEGGGDKKVNSEECKQQ